MCLKRQSNPPNLERRSVMQIEMSEWFKRFLEDFFVSANRLRHPEDRERFKKGMQGRHEEYLVALLLGLEKDLWKVSRFAVGSSGSEENLAEAKKLLGEEGSFPGAFP